MILSKLRFDVSSTESLPPDESRAGEIFSRLGYNIHDAIADLVDNSVDAEASIVQIRFVRSPNGIHSVIIADNGRGMTAAELQEAMRFGSRSTKAGSQLGKYGIGLKSASLSQAEVVTVLSRQGAAYVGRRWKLENIKKNWACELLTVETVRGAIKSVHGPIHRSKSATVVIWEKLEHLRALPENLDRVLENTRRNLSIELGIRFHRFLQSGQLEIFIDEQFADDDKPGEGVPVLPLDPFGYETSGNPSYPVRLKLNLAGTPVVAECHIWPPRSNHPGYRLGGGKVSMRQGFYFYRNDRVIQAGGWNGIRADDGEPHLSLARVKVDLPSELDSMFKLDVTKSHLDPSPSFVSALQSAKSGTITFAVFLDHADRAYRKHKISEGAKFPFVPGNGFTAKARRSITDILQEKGTGRAKSVKFRWASLDPDEIFRLGKDCEILLNTRYRRDIAPDRQGDAPLFKLALMFLLQKDLGKTFLTKKGNDWLQKVNHALIASLKE